MSNLQPKLSLEEMTDEPAEIESPQVLHDLKGIIRVWSESRDDLPVFFGEEFKIAKVERHTLFFVGAQIQRVSLTPEMVLEAYDQTPIDAQPWPSNDLFQLISLETTAFPAQPVGERDLVGGRQQLLPCESCDSAGTTLCSSCEGAGGRICANCEGGGSAVCPTCQGVGVVTNRQYATNTCRTCRGRRTISCPGCSGDGRMDCQPCRGEGSLTCQVCQGNGQLKESWAVLSEVATVRRHQLLGKAELPDFTSDLVFDSHQIVGGEIELLGCDDWEQQITDLVPRQISWLATDIVSRAKEEIEADSGTQSRATGVRIGLYGSYLYRIELDYHGQPAVLYVGGNSDQVFPETLIPRSRNIFVRIWKWVDRLFGLIGMGTRHKKDKQFLEGVQSRDVHIHDTNQLATGLRALGPTLQRTKQGYDMVLAVENPAGPPTTVRLELQFGVDPTGQILIAAQLDLGNAVREEFPRMLEMNRDFDFGHIALVQSTETSAERFVLIDRRPYHNLQAQEYYWILMDMARNSQYIVSTAPDTWRE